jgi:lipopolysaccharide export system permease protein
MADVSNCESGISGVSIIERYLLRRMTALFFAATGASLGIVWTVQALAKINLVTDTGQSIGAFLKLASLLLPTVVPIVLPFAVLIGITQTLTTMNTDSELAVIAASGARRSVVYKPAVFLALLVCAVVALVSHVVEPYSRQAVRAMVASANSDLLALAVQEGSFKKVEENLYIQISERLPDGQLGGIFMADSRDPSADLIYYAKTGFVAKNADTSMLVMNDGEAHRKDPHGGNFSIIRFNSYAFDLSAFQKTAGGIVLLPKDHTTKYLLNPDKNDKEYQSRPQRFAGVLHKRLTAWIYPLVFALIALAVAGGARSHRESRLNATMESAGAAMALRWAGLYVEDLAEDSMIGVYALYLLPAAAICLCVWAIARQRRLRLVSLPARAAKFVSAAAQPALRRLRPLSRRLRQQAQGQRP